MRHAASFPERTGRGVAGRPDLESTAFFKDNNSTEFLDKVGAMTNAWDMRAVACAAFLIAASTVGAEPALADFRLCNNTGNRVGIAVGYKENEGWTTEGWWNIPARSCETVLRGGLVARFYYIYAVDYDRGGEWSGQAFMCTREKEFTIRGTEDCLARGYDRTGFFEVDTGDQPSWTVQLTESADQVPMEQPLQSRVPMLQSPPAAAKPGTPPPTFRGRN
jgi:uncharacterized membrane protein